MRRLGSLVVAAVLSAAATTLATQTAPAAPLSVGPPRDVSRDVPASPRAVDPIAPAPPVSAAWAASPASSASLSAAWSDPSSAGPGPDEIPPAARVAYARAAAVLDRVVPTCGLTWPVLAALGFVESRHGQAAGSHLDADGREVPPLLGPPLDGRPGTARRADTDRGVLDADASVDRAVGPLQLLPGTWAVVAVDGDGDGRRDPQDLDDAALAAAVYLCGRDDDLTSDPGLRRALLRWDPSPAFVDVVLAVVGRYAAEPAPPATPVSVLASAPPTETRPTTAPTGTASWSEPDDSWLAATHWSSAPTPQPPPTPPPPTPPTPPPPPTSTPTPPTPTPTPTPEPSPQPTPTPTPSPTVEPSPDDPPRVPDPTAPADPDPAWTPEQRAALATCAEQRPSGSAEELATCLAQALELPVDDPVVLRLAGLPPARLAVEAAQPGLDASG